MSKRRWAAVAVVVLAVGCSSGDDDDAGGGGGDDGAGSGLEIVGLTGSVMGPDGLVSALEDERNASMLSAVGLSGAIAGAELREVRAATDDDLAAVGRDDGAELFPSSEAVAETLAGLRQEIDAAAGPHASIAQFDLAFGFDQRYRTVVDQYRTACETAIVDLVDDPDLREGLELQVLVGEISGREFEILFRMFNQFLGETPVSPEGIAELSRLATEQQADVDTMLAADVEPYRSVIESSGLEEHHQAMAAYVDRAVNGEQVSMTEVLETAGGESPELQTYFVLRLELAVAVEAEAG